MSARRLTRAAFVAYRHGGGRLGLYVCYLLSDGRIQVGRGRVEGLCGFSPSSSSGGILSLRDKCIAAYASTPVCKLLHYCVDGWWRVVMSKIGYSGINLCVDYNTATEPFGEAIRRVGQWIASVPLLLLS